MHGNCSASMTKRTLTYSACRRCAIAAWAAADLSEKCTSFGVNGLCLANAKSASVAQVPNSVYELMTGDPDDGSTIHFRRCKVAPPPRPIPPPTYLDPPV